MVASQIELKPSLGLQWLIAVMGLLALLAIALAEIAPAMRAALIAGLLIGITWQVAKVRKPLPDLKLTADGQIQLGVAGAEWIGTEVLPGSFVAPRLCVLRLRTDDARLYGFTLLPDSAAPDDLRRIRVSLRWASRTRSDTAIRGAD